MRIISTSYSRTASFDDPHKWLRRINFYTGILEELAKQHEVISLERINYTGELFQNKVRYIFIEQEKEVEIVPNKMHALIRKISPDIVLVNGFIFPLQILQLRLKIGPKPRIIVINRSEKPGSGWRGLLQKLADRQVFAYLFPSKMDGEKWIEKGIINNKKKIREVMHASSDFIKEDKKTAREKLNIEGDPLFLWVGRLDSNKDPITVVKAFIKFLENRPSARLYMIYQQDELSWELKDLIEKSHTEKKIWLVGKVEHDQLSTWYSAVDFIISGSHSEGGGIAIIEAMSCGAIPILTRIPSYIKMTDNGKCGGLYSPGNRDALYAFLLLTPEMDIEIESQKVKERFENEFSYKAIASKIDATIQ